MKSTYKTKEELIGELEEMRQRIKELEKAKIEKKRVEKALRESEEKYRTIFENVYDQVVYINKYGTITAANDREKIFGRKPEEIIGKNFTKLGYFDIKDLPKMFKLFKDIITDRKKIELMELEVKHKDGHKIPIEVSTRLVKKEGRIDGFLCMIRDITERKKTEEALQKAHDELEKRVKERTAELMKANMQLKKEIDMRKSKEKALREAEKLKRETLKKLTLQLAHEIKNPLSSIKSSAQLIEMDNSNKEKHKILRHMDIINKNVDICSRVIRDLYRFAHQPKLELKKVDISGIIKRIEIYVLEKIEKDKKVKVDLRIGKEIPKIFIDEFRLLQVLKNIINNSFDAISNHGVLTIHSEYINNCKEVLIEITDNGRGIKEKDVDHIFHPFFSSKSTGFGLGLPLSKDIIEAHKGKIAVESKEGKGTTVRIRLPAD